MIGARDVDLFRPQVHVTVDGKGRRAPEGTIIDLGLQQDIFVRRALDDVGKGAAYGEKTG